MSFELLLTDQAMSDLETLESNQSLKKQLKAVLKTLGYLQLNPRHPSLNTHKYHSLVGKNNEEIFEAYAENHTPGAYRIFWHYGPKKNQMTILAITKHP